MYSFVALKTNTPNDPVLPEYCKGLCSFCEEVVNTDSVTEEITSTYYCWAHNHREVTAEEIAAETRPEWCPLYKVSIEINGYLENSEEEDGE